MKKILSNQSGLTLPEVMVGIALAAVATAVVFSVFVSTQNAYYDTREISSSQSELRLVANMIGSEIRAAGSDPRESVNAGIITAGDATFSFSADLNGDGVIDAVNEPAEQISYVFDNADGELFRVTGAGTALLMSNMNSFSFQYFAVDGSELLPVPLTAAQLGQLRTIQLNFDVKGDDGVDRQWSNTVSLRNDLGI